MFFTRVFQSSGGNFTGEDMSNHSLRCAPAPTRPIMSTSRTLTTALITCVCTWCPKCKGDKKVITENSHSRGYRFVCFTSFQDSLNAKNEMNGKMWGSKLGYLGVAQCREEHHDYFAHQNIQMLSLHCNTPEKLLLLLPT